MSEIETEIKEIISGYFEEPIEVFEKISGGASHHTYGFRIKNGEEYVLKASDYDWSGLPSHEHGFDIDGPVLRYMEDKPVPTPEVLDFDNSEKNFDFKYLITERVSGKNMFEAWDSIDLSTVREAGRILARVHNSLSFEKHGKLGWKDEGKTLGVEKEIRWSDMVEDMLYSFSENFREQTEFSDLFDEVRELFDEKSKALENDRPSVLLHQEFSPRNMMTENGDITGVIDWERAIAGDPEFDLFIAERQFTAKTKLFEETQQEAEEIHKALRAGYKEVRGLQDGWRERRKLYHLVYIAQVMWVLDEVVDEQKLREEYSEIKENLSEK